MKVAIHNNEIRVQGAVKMYALPHSFNQIQQHMLRSGLEQDWDEAQFPSSVRIFLPQLMKFLVECATTEAQAGHLPGRLQMVDAIWTTEEQFIIKKGQAFAVHDSAVAKMNAAYAAEVAAMRSGMSVDELRRQRIESFGTLVGVKIV